MEHPKRENFEKLAKRLSDLNDSKYASFIEDLKNLEFDDFMSEKYDMPKMEMHKQAMALDLKDVAEAVINGDYDQ